MNKLLFFLLLPCLLLADPTEIRFTGEAVDQKGDLVYREEHSQTFENGVIQKATTYYYSPTDELIAQLTSEFVASPYLPNYDMVNYMRDKEDRVIYKNGHLVVSVRPPHKTEFTTKDIAIEAPATLGEGLYFYLFDHIDELLSEGSLKANVLAPSRFRFYHLTTKLVDHSDNLITLSVETGAFYLRLLLPQMKIICDIKNKRLLSYDGLAPFRDDRGRLQHVKVKYSY